ncbi:ribonuclease Le37 [Dacryopinax primogenitus]|uniref:Ribonuclease T2-like n=1 Tax=Dacryopinax primogenitus (strain DJM 731) TaxID=1858805 RepID=M5FXW8_DACPD|nr:ribonuclease Le37 [Dacryopinax primogenitus]EJU02891.1 ribonuclease Le37 [Dacryopinax primogenitus]
MVVALTFAVAATTFTSHLDAGSLFPRTSCSASTPLSCHNTTKQTNLCCFESPGGSILQTQFWDTDPSTGPTNSWTIHGLWPDHCDNSYSENCDPSRYYSSITNILENAGATDVLSYMQTYWKNDPNDGSDEEFWEHEWDTHGTCYSTLAPACISSNVEGQDAVYFFTRVVNTFKTLNTYDFLFSQGITPSSSQTHTLSSLQTALKSAYGYTPALTCSGSDLNQIAYYFNLQGSLIDGVLESYDAPSGGSDCPTSGIRYLPKSGSGSSPPPTTTTTSAGTSPTRGAGLPNKATLQSSTGTGCLLSYGTWSTQTCATFTFSGTLSGFTLTSSKGGCGVQGGILTCGNENEGTFTALSASGGEMSLAWGGSTTFSSDAVPSGQVQERVYTGSGHEKVLSFIIS